MFTSFSTFNTMSKITIINKSNITLCLTAENESYILYPSQVQCIVTEKAPFHFSAYPDSVNRIDYLFKSAGIISKRHFVLVSDFQLRTGEECEVSFYTNTKKGRFRDEYEYCVPYCSQGTIDVLHHSVKDEESFRQEFEQSGKKGKRALLVLDFFDILGNALAGILLLVIPFLFIWLFWDIRLAWNICSVAFIPIFIIIVIINRILDKLKKAAWQKGKSFALRKQIFKDYNSYFQQDYISSVLDK